MSEPGFDRKRKTKQPCKECGLHLSRCICSLIPRLDLKTKLCLVVHAKELKRTTNTGRLALKALVNSTLRVRGQLSEKTEAVDLSDLLDPAYRSVLFYPAENALELNAAFVALDPRPIQLIVPDGNWRQASKVHYRHLELQHLPRVMIQKPNLEKHHLRKENSKEGMSTLHAIAEAFGVIEGLLVREKLMALYHEKLQATLTGRGIIS